MKISNISNIITSIRNLHLKKKKKIQVIFTKITKILIKNFFQEGFIKNIRKYKKKLINIYIFISFLIKKNINKPILKQISRPSLRIYSNYKKIPKFFGGVGITYYSTSKGIIKDQEVKFNKIGGEVLYYIW
nr:ribosomal protein S8 [Thismia rodwayi]